MPTLTRLLHALADLTANEPAAPAQATAMGLRAAAPTRDFPAQPASTLTPGLRAALQLPNALPLCRLIKKAQALLPWADSPAASLQPTSLTAIKSIAELMGPDGPI
ncbi:MAG: hypothetical protein B7Z31_07685, partial [Rhodobacterales bacterium 12-65-15]